jgi:hypothetical protein
MARERGSVGLEFGKGSGVPVGLFVPLSLEARNGGLFLIPGGCYRNQPTSSGSTYRPHQVVPIDEKERVFSRRKRGHRFHPVKREGEGLLEGGHRVVQWSIIQWVG